MVLKSQTVWMVWDLSTVLDNPGEWSGIWVERSWTFESFVQPLLMRLRILDALKRGGSQMARETRISNCSLIEVTYVRCYDLTK